MRPRRIAHQRPHPIADGDPQRPTGRSGGSPTSMAHSAGEGRMGEYESNMKYARAVGADTRRPQLAKSKTYPVAEDNKKLRKRIAYLEETLTAARATIKSHQERIEELEADLEYYNSGNHL